MMYIFFPSSTFRLIQSDPKAGLLKLREEIKNLTTDQIKAFWIACLKLISEDTVIELRRQDPDDLLGHYASLIISEKVKHTKRNSRATISRTTDPKKPLDFLGEDLPVALGEDVPAELGEDLLVE